LFVHPGSRISNPGSKNSMKKEEDEKIIGVLPFFVATNITKLKPNFIFEQVKKKLRGQFTKNYRTFYPKNWH
jgi:hypothetical protein